MNAQKYQQSEAEHIQEVPDNFDSTFAEDGTVKLAKAFSLSGPGSITCDRVGPVTIEDCKTCWGTGSCKHGKMCD